MQDIDLTTFESSAKKQAEEQEMDVGMSFMETKNSKGPSTLPCGIPDKTGRHDKDISDIVSDVISWTQ